METTVHVIRGRQYEAYRQDDGQFIIKGPPEGLVDTLGLPEPIATRLHNILFTRGIRNYRDATRNPNNVIGALQEAFALSAADLTEAWFKYENQEVPHE